MPYSYTGYSVTTVGRSSNNDYINYQWYKATDENDTTNGTRITSGGTSSSYSIPITTEVGEHYYYCVVSAQNHYKITSRVVKVTVERSEYAGDKTATGTVYAGIPVTDKTFNLPQTGLTYGTPVRTGGTGNFVTGAPSVVNVRAFKFSADDTSVVGQTEIWTIPVAETTNYHAFEVIATITAETPPTISITDEPDDTEVSQGESEELQVKASLADTAATLTYQWYKTNSSTNNDATDTTNVTAVSGATSSTYDVPDDLSQSTHYYFCVVGATYYSSVTSTVATVTVTKPNWATQTINISVPDTAYTGSVTPSLPTGGSMSSLNDTTLDTNGLVTADFAAGGTTTINYEIAAKPNGTTGTVTIDVGETDYKAYTLKLVFKVKAIVITAQTSETPAQYAYGAAISPLSVTATADSAINYQWYTCASDGSNPVLIDGAESSAYTPSDLDVGTYYYRCELSADGYHNDKYSNVMTIEIKRADFPGTRSIPAEVVKEVASTGNEAVLLDIPAGASYGTPAIAINLGLLSTGPTPVGVDIVVGTPTISGNTLYFDVNAFSEGIATIKIPVTGATNYKDYELTVSVLPVDGPQQA